MAQDPETGEPLIEFFQHSNINAVQRVLARAERTAKREAAKHGRAAKVRPSKLMQSLNRAMSAWGRSAKGSASIRKTAPDTGGRPYHFGYSTVSRGESPRGKAGRTGTAAAKPKPSKGGGGRPGVGAPGLHGTGRGGGPRGRRDRRRRPRGRARAQSRGGLRTRGRSRGAGARQRGRQGRRAGDRPGGGAGEGDARDRRVADVRGEDGEAPGRGRTAAERRRLAREAAEWALPLLAGVEARESAAAAREYIENPAKLMGTTALFGTIGETLAERMAFWNLVHDHENAKGGRTRARMVTCRLQFSHRMVPGERGQQQPGFPDAKTLKQLVRDRVAPDRTLGHIDWNEPAIPCNAGRGCIVLFHGECTTMRSSEVFRSALVSGSYTSVASTVALALAARIEGKGLWQPLNATSHWRNGGGAATHRGVDRVHTGVGYVTNHAACLFWALFFEAWRAWRGPVRPVPMLRDAILMAAVAAAVDYGATRRRFTPGWELVLSKKGMAVAYAGLALGLAAGASRTQSRRAR